MTSIALSSQTTTGIFTLLGTLGGIVFGGLLAFLTEFMRRRWTRQEAIDNRAAEHSTALNAERKDLYSKLLSSGLNIEHITGPFSTDADTPDNRTQEEKDAAVAAIWPKAVADLREFDYLVSRLRLVAGPTVTQLAEQWGFYLI